MRHNSFQKIYASYIAPNPEMDVLWMDLNADPYGSAIKFWNGATGKYGLISSNASTTGSRHVIYDDTLEMLDRERIKFKGFVVFDDPSSDSTVISSENKEDVGVASELVDAHNLEYNHDNIYHENRQYLDYVTGINTGDQDLSGKVDKVDGMGLSDNNLTDELIDSINASLMYGTTIADNVNSVLVGGAQPQPASQWKERTVVQALDTILFPTILASIKTPKSVSISVSGASGTLEIGTTVSRTITASFNRGEIYNGDGTVNSNPLVGASTSYTFSGTGLSSTTQPEDSYVISNVISSGTNNWAVTVDHEAGAGEYYDNKSNIGTNLSSSRAAGTTSDLTSSPPITGVYPYFYLKSNSEITAESMKTAIENGTATKVVATSTGTITIPYNVSSEYIAVAYPSTSATKTKYYVTALDTGAITVVFNDVETKSVSSSNSYWSGVSYKIHTSKSALTNTNANIELRNL